MYNCPLLASKTTFARIDFLQSCGLLVKKNVSYNVKFYAEKFTQIKKYSAINTFG